MYDIVLSADDVKTLLYLIDNVRRAQQDSCLTTVIPSYERVVTFVEHILERQ